jgi:predicted DNA-binding protein (MmcQ/YjbR family)
MNEDEMNKQDEIVTVRLPRSEYDILRTLIQERETYRNVVTLAKTHWIWIVGGGVLTLYTLWDKLHMLLVGVK